MLSWQDTMPVLKDRGRFATKSAPLEWDYGLAQGAMKSEQTRMKSADADEIKSVLSSREAGFHHEVISSTVGGFIPSVGRI